MALALIKEEGSGLPDANSYAEVADGDAYHDGHLYTAAWTAAPAENKVKALVMATRLIDAEYQFNGIKVLQDQALQWPRENCQDPDGDVWGGGVVASDVVPKAVVDATCEMARELLVQDRTAAPPGEGITEEQSADLTRTVYCKRDTRPIISHVAQAMLGKYGALVSGSSGMARLIRV